MKANIPVDEMRAVIEAFEDHFLREYGTGDWCDVEALRADLEGYGLYVDKMQSAAYKTFDAEIERDNANAELGRLKDNRKREPAEKKYIFVRVNTLQLKRDNPAWDVSDQNI